MFRGTSLLLLGTGAAGCAIWENCFGPASSDWPEEAPKEEDTRCCGSGTCSSANATHPMLGCGAWEDCFYGKCCGSGTCATPSPPPPPTPVPPFPPPMPGTEHHWAVLVAGSNSYSNYRHQADICHAYQIMKAKGVPEEQIIVLAYDDIANSRSNPFPGKIYNKPDPNGPGVDVYAGCNIDYKGRDVNPTTFKNVLTGQGSGKVLKSTSADNVFIFFSDHGAAGLIAFPSKELHKNDLQKTLQTMADQQMFKKLVFYLESCESGSMFKGMDIPCVYGLSASNPTESSWGTYCSGKDSTVNGKQIGSCLGDLFSVSWMEDSDSMDTTQEDLDAQFQSVHTLTDKSEVMQWGDLTFTADKVSEYVGGLTPKKAKMSKHPATAGAVSARQVDLERLYNLYSHAATSAERLLVAEELQAELAAQLAVDTVYTRFLEILYPSMKDKQELIRQQKVDPSMMDCEMSAHEAFRIFGAPRFDANSGFALQFHQIVVNVCADVAGTNVDVAAAAQVACEGLV